MNSPVLPDAARMIASIGSRKSCASAPTRPCRKGRAVAVRGAGEPDFPSAFEWALASAMPARWHGLLDRLAQPRASDSVPADPAP
jgi:hypothetical protein